MIQHFRRMSQPGKIVRATFYTGSNLNEVIELGVKIQADDGKIKVLYSNGVGTHLARLADNTWVFADPDMPDTGAAKMLNEGPFRAVYGYPISEKQAAMARMLDRMAKVGIDGDVQAPVEDAASPVRHTIIGPKKVHVFVYGDSRAELVEAALAEGRKAFGEDASMKVDFGIGGLIKSSESGKPEFCGSADVFDVTEEPREPNPEPSPLIITVRGEDERALRARAILEGRQFFGMDRALEVDFTGPVRDISMMGQKEYSAQVSIRKA